MPAFVKVNPPVPPFSSSVTSNSAPVRSKLLPGFNLISPVGACLDVTMLCGPFTAASGVGDAPPHAIASRPRDSESGAGGLPNHWL